MADTKVTKNLRDGVLTVLDGAALQHDGSTAGANSLEVLLDEGDLSFSRPREFVQILDRGALSHTRKSSDVVITGSFSAKFVDMNLYHTLNSLGFNYLDEITGLSAAGANNNEALTKTKILGSATAWNDANAASYSKIPSDETPVQGEWHEDSGDTIDIYTIAGDTTFDVDYLVAGVTTTGEPMALLNRGFTRGTTGELPTSWVKTGNANDGSTFIKSAAFAYKDSYSGAGALGGSDSSVDINQTVTPASVSSGDVFEFSVWLRGTAAMSANLTLAEYDVGGSNDSSTNAYTIVANEYWTFHRVRHQITDAASDRMVVGININDAGTLYVDNAVLQRNGTMNVNTVDLQFVINDGKASEAAQDTVLLRDLHIEGIDFSEGDEYNTLSFNFFSFTDVPDIS